MEEQYVMKVPKELSSEDVENFLVEVFSKAKKRYPDKAEHIDGIQVRHRFHEELSVVDITIQNPSTVVLFLTFAGLMARDAWREIIIPLIQKKYGIEPRKTS